MLNRHFIAALLFLLTTTVLSARQSPAETAPIPTARAVVADLVAGRFAEVYALFLPPMQAALPEAKLNLAWTSVTTVAGAFKEQGRAQVETKGAFRVVVITCAFERASVDVQMAFDADGKIAGLSMRPSTADVAAYVLPSYASPTTYRESEVTVGAAGWPLPGTLTMPVGDGPFPAVVLVHGSGPQDRDATIGPNRVFKDLALGLASRGIAVLRYEKRTKQLAARLNREPRLTVRGESIDDAIAAADWLKTAPGVDRSRVFILGHSLGGMLVPRMAATDSTIRGFIALAGAVRSLEQSIVEQTRYLIMADGQLSPEEQQQLMEVERLAGTVRALTPADAESGTSIGGAPAAYWLDLRGYDPPAAAATVPQPLLILQGERDYQVTMADFAKWRTALARKPNATLKSYPMLNHLFMVGVGPSLPAEYTMAGHVAEAVVRDIADWILAQK